MHEGDVKKTVFIFNNFSLTTDLATLKYSTPLVGLTNDMQIWSPRL